MTNYNTGNNFTESLLLSCPKPSHTCLQMISDHARHSAVLRHFSLDLLTHQLRLTSLCP